MDARPFLLPFFCSSPYNFLEKRSGVFTGGQPLQREEERRSLTSCPSRSLSHLFPYHLLLFLLQPFCTFPLLPIHVVCSLTLLNNNPSVWVSV